MRDVDSPGELIARKRAFDHRRRHLGNRPGGGHAKHRRDADRRPGAIRRIEIPPPRSEEHTSELQSLMRISYAVFCLKKKNTTKNIKTYLHHNNQNYNTTIINH